ncbi:MAG: hypothetical protein SGPRY_000362 [Prymnesium sp.]
MPSTGEGRHAGKRSSRLFAAEGEGPSAKESTEASPPAKRSKLGALKRENKNQPRVLSSKRQVSSFRVAPGLKDEMGASNPNNMRDPRFDPMSSGDHFNEQGWRHSYAFLFEAQSKRIEELQEKLKLSDAVSKSKACKSGGGARKRRTKAKILSPEAAAEMRVELTRLQNRQKLERQKEKEREVLAAIRKEEVAAVKDGKGVFYQKKSAIREKLLLAKYEDLKKSGKIEKFLAKRRKKVASKQHKRLPGRRNDFDVDGPNDDE